ncbi:MAG: DUF2905 domain-containing protein [Deltaproteobacteria bacterium]|uniref:DUF2905 domain-containing protein n=1 Tax=Candidatus Zymogenus saltonus TaxID=2844893 RepID=A0A9D8PP55_9DELT|nr:DUF2905 domain-containing protein [Candidatus Zymogenus saltonus]
MGTGDIGRMLVVIGLLIVVLGLFLIFHGKVPFLGKLPGDIIAKRENFTLYFPLTKMILISVILSLVFLFFRK